MMGILPDIARSLGVSIPEAGHLISAYALGVCFGAPLMVLVARKRPLKQILLALTAMIAAGNLCASLAPDYWSLLGLRFVSGLPHGAFFGVGSIVAERVAALHLSERHTSLFAEVANKTAFTAEVGLFTRFRYRRYIFHRFIEHGHIVPKDIPETVFVIVEHLTRVYLTVHFN
mgnify:CR=1 FL=1